ncbi:MAG: class E sortase [Actinomycetota bacterium]|nr:class E sortase [Actinomycetota bacterium]
MTDKFRYPGREHEDRGGNPGPRSYAVFDANSRQRRRGIAVLVLLVLTSLLAAQAAFGFPLPDALLPGLGDDEPKVDRPAPSPAERHDAAPSPLPPPKDPTLYLSVPRLGLERNTVRNDESEIALARGAIKLPQTGFPWHEGANTYIACHRLGYPLTESHNQCRNLPAMRKGDNVILEDSAGSVYHYRVTETLSVLPHETQVANPVPGRQVVSLQTCIEAPGDLTTLGPDWGARFIVRADLVETRAQGADR